MSQKDQEAAIDEKIERIRRKNEEIQRRYLEVEADKLNAEKANAAVKFTPTPPKNPSSERKISNRPQLINKNPRFERRVPDKPYVAKHQSQGKKPTFPENDGPPPDPVYSFLSDSSRDAPKSDNSSEEKSPKENTSSGEFRGGRGGGRGWNRGRGNANRGGRRGPGNQPFRQSPQMQPEYQAWRAEREKIDQDRITRQKTAEGNWRREWDSKKLSQDSNEDQNYHSRPAAFVKKKKRDSEEFKIQRTVVNNLAVSSNSPKEQNAKASEQSATLKPTFKGPSTEKKSVAFRVNKVPSDAEREDDLEDFEFEQRNIVSCGDSFKISVTTKPIKSVKVNPVNTAGTGRVGPRQKPILSYSSQSEDEREAKPPPVFHKRSLPVNQNESPPVSKDDASKKPPLPPRGNNNSPRKRQGPVRSTVPISKETESNNFEKKELSRESSRENVSEGGDDSWEDVATTSGNESAEFSDAEIGKRQDESEMAADEEEIQNIKVNEHNKLSGQHQNEALATDEMGANDQDAIQLAQEVDYSNDELPPFEEDDLKYENFHTALTEVGSNQQGMEPTANEGELTEEENDFSESNEKLNEVDKESCDEKYGDAENVDYAEASNVVEEDIKKVEGGACRIKEESASLSLEKSECLKAVEKTTSEDSVIDKNAVVTENKSDIKSAQTFSEENSNKQVIPVDDYAKTDIDITTENDHEDKVLHNQETSFTVNLMNDQGKNYAESEDILQVSPDGEKNKLDSKSKTMENDVSSISKAVEETGLTEIDRANDNCAQSIIVSDAQKENVNEEGSDKSKHELHPITKQDET